MLPHLCFSDARFNPVLLPLPSRSRLYYLLSLDAIQILTIHWGHCSIFDLARDNFFRDERIVKEERGENDEERGCVHDGRGE